MAWSSSAISYRPPRRRRGVLTWIAAACVAAVLVEVGAVTNGFGLAPWFFPSKGSSPPGPPGPNPNPYNEMIFGVTASITYTNGNRSFPALQGTDLCNLCPELPKENATYSPPVAGVWFYFNVTNEGTNSSKIANFTLATSGADPTLFRLVGVVCCAPTYEEVVSTVYFTPGQKFGFGGYAVAPSLPFTSAGGFTLYFNVTSP